MELARRWPNNAGPTSILTTVEGSRLIHDLGIDNVATHVVSAMGASVNMVSWAYLVRTLMSPILVWHLMRRARPRIVLSATLFPPDVVGSLVARALGADWVHSWQLVIPPPGVGYHLTGLRWSLQRPPSPGELASAIRHSLSYISQNLSLLFAKRWCKKLIVPTHVMASEALKHGFRQDQVHVANYGIDPTEVANGIEAGGAAWTDHCDGIFVGQFRPQKGLDDLIAIWRRVQERLPRARLAVIGDGSGLAAVQFKGKIKQFNDQTVSLLGVISGPDKYAALSGSKVFLFPSHHESWGLVALEAMAAGVPVIGYDIPSSREAFGDAMLSVPAFDVDAFANAVVRCLSNEPTREIYRQRGIQIAATYDWDTIAQQFAQSVLAQ